MFVTDSQHGTTRHITAQHSTANTAQATSSMPNCPIMHALHLPVVAEALDWPQACVAQHPVHVCEEVRSCAWHLELIRLALSPAQTGGTTAHQTRLSLLGHCQVQECCFESSANDLHQVRLCLPHILAPSTHPLPHELPCTVKPKSNTSHTGTAGATQKLHTLLAHLVWPDRRHLSTIS